MNAARPLALVLAALLTACGQPVPAEKAAYVGHWTAPNMSLSITQEGSVEYQRVEGSSSTSVSGPLQGFKGDNRCGPGNLDTAMSGNSAL